MAFDYLIYDLPALIYILSHTIVARFCISAPIFPLDCFYFFQIFVTVINFKENYFQFKTYTISNFHMLNCSHLTPSSKKIKKKSIAAFSMKMIFKKAIFWCSVKDALLDRSPGHWLLGRKYMKKHFSISRQYLMGAVVKYNYHLLFLRGTVSLACLKTIIFHWKKSPN